MASAIGNARWIALSQAFRVSLQLVSLFVLARLLPPSEYGLMAMASVVTNLAMLLRELGLSAAVIQRRMLTNETTCTVFWINVLMGSVICMFMLGASPWIASVFRESKLQLVMCALAIVFPLTSVTAVQQALLERDSQFAKIARIEISSAVIALSVALIAAWKGAGVYSLVLQSIVGAALSSMQLWLTSSWRPKLIWSTGELKSLIGFSGNLTLFNFLAYFARNTDSMVIGRYLGSASLGMYSMAYKLMLFPIQNLTAVATRALYPVMSNKQDALEEVAVLYLRAVGLIALVTAPLMAGLYVLREPFVRFAFGAEWDGVAEILGWLAPTGFIQSVVSTTGTVFMARGRTDIQLKLGILGTFLQVGAFMLGVQWGVLGVVKLYFLSNLVNAIPALWVTVNLVDARFTRLLMVLRAPIGSALIMAIVITGLDFALPVLRNTGHWLLIIGVPVGGITYFAAIVFVFRLSLKDLKALIPSKSNR